MNTELIARLEAAEVGSRELDWTISDLMGCIPNHVPFDAGPPYSGWRASREDRKVLERPADCEGRSVERWIPSTVTTSLDCSLALADRVVGERTALSMLFIVAGCCDSIRKLPLGLCIAVLRALDAQEGA